MRSQESGGPGSEAANQREWRVSGLPRGLGHQQAVRRRSTSRKSIVELDLNWVLEPGHHQTTSSNIGEASNAGRRENAEKTLSYKEKGDRSPHKKPPLRLRSGRTGVGFQTDCDGRKKGNNRFHATHAQKKTQRMTADSVLLLQKSRTP